MHFGTGYGLSAFAQIRSIDVSVSPGEASSRVLQSVLEGPRDSSIPEFRNLQGSYYNLRLCSLINGYWSLWGLFKCCLRVEGTEGPKPQTAKPQILNA